VGTVIESDATAVVTLEALSDEFDPGHEAFLEQVDDLRHDLQDAGVSIVAEHRPGTKGAADLIPVVQVVVSGGAGLAAVCSVAKLWIRQRGKRVLRFRATSKDGRTEQHIVTAENVSDETLLRFLERILDGSTSAG
jgi:hypothetical protein